jgi:DNA-binding MarR family transcriptional regulator
MLVSREVNPLDNREVLVCQTRTGVFAHETILAAALERNQRLLEGLSKEEAVVLLEHIDRLTDTAAKMLEAEKDLS